MIHVYLDVMQDFTTRGQHIVSIKAQTGRRKRRRVVKKKLMIDRTSSCSRILTALYFCSSGCQL